MTDLYNISIYFYFRYQVRFAFGIKIRVHCQIKYYKFDSVRHQKFGFITSLTYTHIHIQFIYIYIRKCTCCYKIVQNTETKYQVILECM